MAEARRSTSVGILAFEDMEVLDYAGPYEVFNVAGEVAPSTGFNVTALGVRPGPVRARGGFAVLPQACLGEAPTPEIVVVPGGFGTRVLMHEASVLAWLRAAASEADLVVSVCTGALVLAAAGLLAGRSATTHHDALDELAEISPTTRIVGGSRFVQSSERIWTAGGISAGIDLSLHLVEMLAGEETRDRVVDEMEWGW